MRFLNNNSLDPHYNMAFDEYCLETLKPVEPVFYLWQNRPSVIIGFGQYARSEVNLPYLEGHGIELARRVTGGGAVYHDLQNLNYSILAPEGSTDAVQLIVDALHEMGVEAEKTGRNDIFVRGRKVSGYARRVLNGWELIHGTLMYDVDIDTLTHALDVPGSKLNLKGVHSVRSRVTNLRDELPQFSDIQQFREALHRILAKKDAEIKLSASDLDSVRELCDTKFATPEWIFQR